MINSTVSEKEVGVLPEGTIGVQQALNAKRETIGNNSSALQLLIVIVFILMSLPSISH